MGQEEDRMVAAARLRVQQTIAVGAEAWLVRALDEAIVYDCAENDVPAA